MRHHQGIDESAIRNLALHDLPAPACVISREANWRTSYSTLDA